MASVSGSRAKAPLMNDRLGELRSGLPAESSGGYGSDIEMGAQLTHGAVSGAQGGAFMSDFFAEIAKIKATMAVIRGNIRLIEQHHGQCLTAISVEQGKASNEKLEILMEATNVRLLSRCACRARPFVLPLVSVLLARAIPLCHCQFC